MMKHTLFFSCILWAVLIFGSCTKQSPQKTPATSSVSTSSEAKQQHSLPDSNKSSLRRVQGQAAQGDSSIAYSQQNAITRAVQKVSPAVVSITATEVVQNRKGSYNNFLNHFFNMPTERKYSSLGSGFIISKDGLVVTNEHVAGKDAREVKVSLADGSQYKAKIVGTDELTDLALLKIQADRSFPMVRFGSSNDVIVGEWSLAVGNPFGLFRAAQPSVTVGVVSALHRDFRPNPNKPRVYLDMIQTDAAINSGNSGGPLVDSRGRVIGVNTFIYTGGTGGGSVGLGFAIPSNRAKKIIQQLSTSGRVKMKYDLGMDTQPMTYKFAVQNHLPGIIGLFVNSVNRDGPAFEAGIVPGDILVRIGKERVQSQKHAQALFREYEVGDTMRVQLVRDQKLFEAKIKLRKKVSGN